MANKYNSIPEEHYLSKHPEVISFAKKKAYLGRLIIFLMFLNIFLLLSKFIQLPIVTEHIKIISLSQSMTIAFLVIVSVINFKLINKNNEFIQRVLLMQSEEQNKIIGQAIAVDEKEKLTDLVENKKVIKKKML